METLHQIGRYIVQNAVNFVLMKSGNSTGNNYSIMEQFALSDLESCLIVGCRTSIGFESTLWAICATSLVWHDICEVFGTS